MVEFDALVEHLAQTFYEQSGLRWEAATDRVRQAMCVEVEERIAADPDVAMMVFRVCMGENVH
ncbi:hypothetical protein ACFWXH_04585 [Mesorhizobium sp. NPDC059054]|uniref:hypothetical protein n=1 Tax=Mesorhizobium sp. NPDC059054 TaxID=3346711 RepID=UPI0036803153